jgi:hypothetical protein
VNIPLVLTHRRTIIVLNGILFLITLGVIYDAFVLFFRAGNDALPIENLLDGIATIFVAYGVALEERDTLMRFFRLYPQYLDEGQKETDAVCHFYGLNYLLVGLFMEVAIETIKLPHKVFNTLMAEEVVFGIGLVFCLTGCVLLLKNMYLLSKAPKAS